MWQTAGHAICMRAQRKNLIARDPSAHAQIDQCIACFCLHSSPCSAKPSAALPQPARGPARLLFSVILLALSICTLHHHTVSQSASPCPPPHTDAHSSLQPPCPCLPRQQHLQHTPTNAAVQTLMESPRRFLSWPCLARGAVYCTHSNNTHDAQRHTQHQQ
jgi:hypothetical protein